MKRVYRVLDLFAGAGGLSLGFEQVMTEDNQRVFDVVCAVEKDAYACETLRFNMKRRGMDPAVVLQADLTDPAVHSKIIDMCNGDVDIIIGGPPCQSFSMIGARNAAKKIRNKWKNDERDRLYLEYVALVKELNPLFLVFENVRGILTKKDLLGKKYIDLVISSIKDCGYNPEFDGSSQEYLILNAADYGVPQIRERVFVIANRLGIYNPVPVPTHSENGHGNTLPWVTLRDAIGDLCPLKAHITCVGLPPEEKQKIREMNKDRYRGKDSIPYPWDRFYRHYWQASEQGKRFLDYIRPELQDVLLTGHMARGQQISDIELFARMPEGITSKDIFRNEDLQDLRKLITYDMKAFQDKYRKQSWDRPCTTVFAHLQKDGNRFIHPDSTQARTLTVREAARIQSFPDDYVFKAPGNVRYKYIGNAVPPLLAKAIAEAIYITLSHWESQKVGATKLVRKCM